MYSLSNCAQIDGGPGKAVGTECELRMRETRRAEANRECQMQPHLLKKIYIFINKCKDTFLKTWQKKKLQSPTEVCVFWRSIPEKQLFYSFLRSNKDKRINLQWAGIGLVDWMV